MNLSSDFPIFSHHPDLVYLDSGATTHKPRSVIDAMSQFLEQDYGTVHRGIYGLSVTATDAYNAARRCVQAYINAPSPNNIVFTRGTTESINFLARGFIHPKLRKGDEILITDVEHHANVVPWQMVAKESGASLVYAPVLDNGDLDIDTCLSMMGPQTAVVSMAHISNVLGSIFPIQRVIDHAATHNIPVIIDGAQAIAHEPLDVQALGADAYCFSGHKMYGPTGIGVCYMSDRVLNQASPVMFGGDMIETVKKNHTTFAPPPLKFEAGTPPITEAIGLHAAIDYIETIGRHTIRDHELALTHYAFDRLSEIEGIEFLGTPTNRAAIISFNMAGIHPHDLGTILDEDGVAVRVGHHCSQLTMTRFNVVASARASMGVYNTRPHIDRLVQALHTAREVFGL